MLRETVANPCKMCGIYSCAHKNTYTVKSAARLNSSLQCSMLREGSIFIQDTFRVRHRIGEQHFPECIHSYHTSLTTGIPLLFSVFEGRLNSAMYIPKLVFLSFLQRNLMCGRIIPVYMIPVLYNRFSKIFE